MELVVIADDLTGALDATAPFLPDQVAVLTSTAALDAWEDDLELQLDAPHVRNALVLGVNTASRHLPPLQAAERVHAAADWAMSRPEHPRIMKKVDSVLRGNVLAELEAIVAACDYPGIVLCPALPAQGRVTIGGVQYDQGPSTYNMDGPLPTNGKATDLRAFVPNGYRVTSVDARSLRPAALANCLQAATNRIGLALVDIGSDEDLAVLAASLRGMPDVLVVGSSGIMRAMGRLRYSPGRDRLTAVSGSQLVVTASQHAAVRGQVRKLAAQRKDAEVIELDVKKLQSYEAADQAISMAQRASAVLTSGGVAVLTVPAVELIDERRAAFYQPASTLINSTLAAATAKILDGSAQPSRLLILGGDVAAAVCHQLDVHTLVPIEEATPGAVICTGITSVSRPTPLPAILVRSGGFGDENNLLTLIGISPTSHKKVHVD